MLHELCARQCEKQDATRINSEYSEKFGSSKCSDVVDQQQQQQQLQVFLHLYRNRELTGRWITCMTIEYI